MKILLLIVLTKGLEEVSAQIEMAGRSRSVGDLDRIGMDRGLDPILDRDRLDRDKLF